MKKKVLLCVPNLNIGGAENVVRHLALSLDKELFDVRVCCISGEGPFAESLHRANIPIISLEKKSRWDIRAVFSVIRVLREYRPHIVHSFLFTAGFWFSIPARLFRNIKVYYSIRSRYGNNPRWVACMERIFILPFAHKITFVSRDSLETYLDVLPSLVERSCVILNGVDVDRFQYLTGPSDQNLFIAIGRLDKPKGYVVLLKAFSRVLEVRPQAELRIVGQGPMQDELHELTREIGLNAGDIFLGERHDIPQLLSQAGIFVSASLWEGIPNTHLEAMAAGMPIVATRVGGVPEILGEDSALLVPPGDVDALYRGMLSMFDDLEMRRRLAREAQERVRKDFPLKEMVRNYAALYQSFDFKGM